MSHNKRKDDIQILLRTDLHKMSQSVIIVPFFLQYLISNQECDKKGEEKEGDEMRRSMANPWWEIAQNFVAAIGIAEANIHLDKVLLFFVVFSSF